MLAPINRIRSTTLFLSEVLWHFRKECFLQRERERKGLFLFRLQDKCDGEAFVAVVLFYFLYLDFPHELLTSCILCLAWCADLSLISALCNTPSLFSPSFSSLLPSGEYLSESLFGTFFVFFCVSVFLSLTLSASHFFPPLPVCTSFCHDADLRKHPLPLSLPGSLPTPTASTLSSVLCVVSSARSLPAALHVKWRLLTDPQGNIFSISDQRWYVLALLPLQHQHNTDTHTRTWTLKCTVLNVWSHNVL